MKAAAHIAATSRSPGNLDLFTVGSDGVVYTTWWYAGNEWGAVSGDWRPIGGFFPPGAPITAVSKSPNSIDLFVTGNDGRVYTSWWYEGSDWSGVNNSWRSIGGFFPAGAPLSVTSRNPGNLDVFVTGNDGRVYTSWWYAGSDWSGIHDNWRGIGGFFPAGAPVRAVTKSPTSIDLFLTGNDRKVYTSWWNAGADWSGIHDNWRPLAPAERHPSITLQAVQVAGEGRFVEVTGIGFTPGKAVTVAYQLTVGGAPTTSTFGEDSLTSDGSGAFVHRVRLASAISAAQVQAIDVASGVKATASL